MIDGAGNPWYRADVGIAGDRIAAVGRVDGEPAERVIDADGLFVCPGFVDMHTHSDLQLLVNPRARGEGAAGRDARRARPGRPQLRAGHRRGARAAARTARRLERAIRPGFDWSWRTVGEYLDRLDADGIAVNAAYLAPHGTIRMCAMGFDDRAPTADELAHMKRLLAEALEQGAVGLSTGLTYTPGMYADDDEIVALLEVVREHGGYYTPHHRNYGQRALEAYADCIEIARRSGVPLHLAHAHLGYEINKGRAPELLAMIDQARDDGIEVTLDTYPYLAGSTYLHAFLPSWMHVGGSAATLERLRDPALRERLRVEIEDEGSDGFHEIPIDWSIDRRSDGARAVWSARSPTPRRRARVRSTSSATFSSSENLGVSCVSHIGQRGERAHDDDALVAHRRQRRDPRRRPAAPALATGRSRATSRSTCASSGSSPGSRRCGR